MNKRGQTEVITTILLILIVLAAVIIVWQVINRFVTKGGGAIESKTACIDIKLNIVSASNSTGDIKVTRLSGGTDDAVANIKILVDGAVPTSITDPLDTQLSQFETQTWTVGGSFESGAKIEVAPVLKDGTLCEPIASATATT